MIIIKSSVLFCHLIKQGMFKGGKHNSYLKKSVIRLPYNTRSESTLKKTVMNYFMENEQDYLAARFHINDSHITQASHLAFLKIQSWKFALRTPTIGKRYREEAQDLINKSFCSFVPNSFVLSEE